MKKTETRHYLVQGRVQGVFFRASTRTEAQRLKLAGWARNLPDGRVEVLAAGDELALNQFEQWLHVGPADAKVHSVEKKPATPERVRTELPDPFEIRR